MVFIELDFSGVFLELGVRLAWQNLFRTGEFILGVFVCTILLGTINTLSTYVLTYRTILPDIILLEVCMS